MIKKYFAAFVLILSIGGLFCSPILPVLSITNRKNHAQRFYSVDGCKNGFIISYTHSVNKGRVKDFYTVTSNQKLLCNTTVFLSYGAGIPEPDDFPDAVFTVTKDGYEITNINRIVDKLTMAVGIIANHAITITHKNVSKDYYFTDFFEPQTSIILEIKRVSLLNYIFHYIK